MNPLVDIAAGVVLFVAIGVVLLRADQRTVVAAPDRLRGPLIPIAMALAGAGTFGLTAGWVVLTGNRICKEAVYCFAPGWAEALVAGMLVAPSSIALVKVIGNVLRTTSRTPRFDIFALLVGIALAASTLLLVPSWYAVLRRSNVEWSPLTSVRITVRAYGDVLAVDESRKTVTPMGTMVGGGTYRVRFRDGDSLVLWNLPGESGPNRIKEATEWLAHRAGLGITSVDVVNLGSP